MRKVETLFEWATRENKDHILKEWDYEKNRAEGIDINTEFKTSKNIAWWKCEKHGHSWQTRIVNRKAGSNCPHCNKNQTSMPEQFLYFGLMKKFKSVKNRKIIEGYEYDIFVEDLNLLIEYDGVLYHKILKDNNKREIKKEQLAYERGYSFIRVEECRLKGDEAIFDNVIRYNYRGRSKVMNRMFSDLVTMINEKFGTDIDPFLPESTLEDAKEHAMKNRKLKSIAYTHPNIVAKAWDYEKNGNIKPTQYSYGSEATLWWKCEKGIHESHQATVFNKVRLKSKCPHCMGNHPKRVYQYDVNGRLLNTYSSIGEARRTTNFSKVTAYAKSNRVTSHGFVFSHEKLEPNLFKRLSN